MGDFPGVRLHVVTGKGGTGKTTVAGALAMALATGGQRVLVCEVEGRQGLAELFGRPPLDYGEQPLTAAPGGGQVHGLAIDAEHALLDYLETFYKLGRAGRALRRLGAVDFATTIAPGLADVLLTGKIKEAVGRRAGRTPVYDAVVVDAPPTGRVGRFLNVHQAVSGLAKVGPIHSQARSVMGLIRSPRCAVHLVTLLEELPVQETLDSVAELGGRLDLPIGGVVINRTEQPALTAAELVRAGRGGLPAAAVAAGLTAAGLPPAAAPGLVAEAGHHATRVAMEEEARDALAALELPTYELPLLDGGVDAGGLQELAAALVEQGLGGPA